MVTRPVIVTFDGRVVRLEAVKKAAYRLSDIVDVQIDIDGDTIRCSLSPAPGHDEGSDALGHRFRSTVLDEDLRERLAEQTAPLRNAILAMAFAPLTQRPAD